MTLRASRILADARLSRNLGQNSWDIPTTGEICAIMRLATELKDCGAFSTLPARELAERTGYRKSDIVNLMRKYDDIFMSVPVSGGYKLKNFSELHGDVERILRRLIRKRVAFLCTAVVVPLVAFVMAVVLAISNTI